MTQIEKQNALLPAATKVDDLARLCSPAIDDIDTGTARLRAGGVMAGDLDAAARLVLEAKKKLQAAHTLIIGVALAN